MNIFSKENIGHNIRCVVEKDGVRENMFVRWHNAIVGTAVKRKISFFEDGKREGSWRSQKMVSPGWTVVEVDV